MKPGYIYHTKEGLTFQIIKILGYTDSRPFCTVKYLSGIRYTNTEYEDITLLESDRFIRDQYLRDYRLSKYKRPSYLSK